MKNKVLVLMIFSCFVFADSPDKIPDVKAAAEQSNDNVISPIK